MRSQSYDHEQIRSDAQSEVHDVAMDHIHVSGYDQYDRDEAADTLGKSWSNIATVYVGSSLVADVNDLIDDLKEMGYVATIGRDGGQVVVEVSITYEVTERLA